MRASGAGSGRARWGVMASQSWGARLGDGAMGARGARAALWGVALLCALGLGQRPPGDPTCGPGRLMSGTGTNARCCGPCASGKARRGRAGMGPGSERRGAAPPPLLQTRPRRGSGQAFQVQNPGLHRKPGEWKRSQLLPVS